MFGIGMFKQCVRQNLSTFIILGQYNKQKHKTQSFFGSNLGQISNAIAEISSRVHFAVRLMMTFVKVYSEFIKFCFLAGCHVFEHTKGNQFNDAFATSMHGFNRCGTKYTTHWIGHGHIVICIIQIMLGPLLTNTCIRTVSNVCHVLAKNKRTHSIRIVQVLVLTNIARSTMSSNVGCVRSKAST